MTAYNHNPNNKYVINGNGFVGWIKFVQRGTGRWDKLPVGLFGIFSGYWVTFWPGKLGETKVSDFFLSACAVVFDGWECRIRQLGTERELL